MLLPCAAADGFRTVIIRRKGETVENKEMIEQIVARVAEKLALTGDTVTADQVMEALAGPAALPGLLVLTQDHGCDCHVLLESGRIKEKFHTCCALMQEYEVELDKIDTVVLFNLTTDAMCKIVSGITDTPYTKLAAKALLLGKKLYVPREEVELYQYPMGGLGSYQCMMQAKLTKLVSWGLKICPMAQLEDFILEENAAEETCSCCKPEKTEKCEDALVDTACISSMPAETEKEITFTKKVITERDIIEANRDNVKVIRITERNILTALAKDAASARNIRLIKE